MAVVVKSRRRRRPRGSLTRDQVVEAALRISDDAGLEALTMPSLARRLDCGVMTLYGYVKSKDQLLDAVAQRGLRDLKLARPIPTDTRGILLAWGRALRRTLLEHPSLPVIFLSRAVVGPGILRGVEALLGPLRQAGMELPAAVQAVYAVLTYTVGFVAWEIPRTRAQSETVYASAWRREAANVPAAELPLVLSVLDRLPRVAGDEQYELGLMALASGLSGAHAPVAVAGSTLTGPPRSAQGD
jgi:TetR/AcrR family tetracycline transcriptional repressor